jgi:hypothetical protein
MQRMQCCRACPQTARHAIVLALQVTDYDIDVGGACLQVGDKRSHPAALSHTCHTSLCAPCLARQCLALRKRARWWCGHRLPVCWWSEEMVNDQLITAPELSAATQLSVQASRAMRSQQHRRAQQDATDAQHGTVCLAVQSPSHYHVPCIFAHSEQLLGGSHSLCIHPLHAPLQPVHLRLQPRHHLGGIVRRLLSSRHTVRSVRSCAAVLSVTLRNTTAVVSE